MVVEGMHWPTWNAATRTPARRVGALSRVHADAGYIGVEKRANIVALERKIDWQIAGKRGTIKAMAEGAKKEAIKAVEKAETWASEDPKSIPGTLTSARATALFLPCNL